VSGRPDNPKIRIARETTKLEEFILTIVFSPQK